MRIVLSILLELLLVLQGYGCRVSQPTTVQTNVEVVAGYEISIRYYDHGSAMSDVMDIFLRNGLVITRVQQTYLANERQEMRISTRNGNKTQLNDVEYQLRSVMNVQSVSIQKL